MGDDPKPKEASSPKRKTPSRGKELATSAGAALKVGVTPVSQVRPEATGSSQDPLATPSAKVNYTSLSLVSTLKVARLELRRVMDKIIQQALRFQTCQPSC